MSALMNGQLQTRVVRFRMRVMCRVPRYPLAITAFNPINEAEHG